MMNADKLHPALPGYQVWADALKPILTEILGPAGGHRSRAAADRRSERERARIRTLPPLTARPTP